MTVTIQRKKMATRNRQDATLVNVSASNKQHWETRAALKRQDARIRQIERVILALVRGDVAAMRRAVRQGAR
jgi:hypothetical protein